MGAIGDVLVLAVDERDAADRRDRPEGIEEEAVVDALDADAIALLPLVGHEQLERAELELVGVARDLLDLLRGHDREVEAEVDVGAPLRTLDLGEELLAGIAREVAVHLEDRSHAAHRRRAGLARVVAIVLDRVELDVRVDRPR